VEKAKGLLHMSGAGEGPQLHLGQGFADADHGFQLKRKKIINRKEYNSNREEKCKE
jgi:hypothetical protein